MIDQIMDYNRSFVERKDYERYLTDKYPDKKLAVLTCMDTRLTELLPAALLSIYVFAQSEPARSDTYYALASFIGALLSILFLGEHLTPTLLLAALIMAAGCFLAAK